MKKNEWIKAQQKSSLEETRDGALRRRSSFKQLSDPDPVTHRKKESRYYYDSSGASRAFPRAEASNRRIHRLLVVLCCCVGVVSIFLYFVR